MQPWKKDGSFSLVAAWTFHLSSGLAAQKLIVILCCNLEYGVMKLSNGRTIWADWCFEFCTSPPHLNNKFVQAKSLFCSIKTFWCPVVVTQSAWIPGVFNTEVLFNNYGRGYRYYGRHLSYQVAPVALPSLYYITSGPCKKETALTVV